MQAQQAEETTTTVKKLQRQVAAGGAPEAEAELEKAEGVLARLSGTLSYLQVRHSSRWLWQQSVLPPWSCPGLSLFLLLLQMPAQDSEKREGVLACLFSSFPTCYRQVRDGSR